MKKRKVYEISVIDKTYSKIISDETKFYTSDTALELGFELKETEYNFGSAEIVLLNIDDRSLVTRPVTKVLGSFSYELEDDITAHYGEWRGQLRFEQAGEIYVSSPVKFRIENDLSNDRPPQLSDVQSWVSLRRYADSLTEKLKQAVLSVEGIEDTFNTNELERQIVFDNNEDNRTETFNTNEATRQENENTRQQAETERATAESSRVSADEQRKIDHANISAELDGKADIAIYEYSPTMLSGYFGGSEGVEKIRIYKDSFGFVHISGRVEGSDLFGPNNPVFNVPKELRPLHVQAGAICLNSFDSFTGLRVSSNNGDCFFTSEPASWTILNFSYFAGL